MRIITLLLCVYLLHTVVLQLFLTVCFLFAHCFIILVESQHGQRI